MYVSVWVFYYYLSFFFFFQSPPFAEAYLEFSFFPFTPPLWFSSLPLFSLLSLSLFPPSFNLPLKSFLLWSDLNGVGLRIAFFLFFFFLSFSVCSDLVYFYQSIHCGSYLWLSLVLTSLRHDNFPRTCDSFLLARLI